MRSSQVKQMIEDICTQPWDHAPPLLASGTFDILVESGRQHLVGTPGVMETLWDELRHGSAFARKGAKSFESFYASGPGRPRGVVEVELAKDLLRSRCT